MRPDLENGVDQWMQSLWADHLDLARCAELIAEEDLGAGVVALGWSLALLQRDLAALSGYQQVDVNWDVNSLEKLILGNP